MCLLLFYVNPNASADELYLILVSVRDEIYTRPTKQAEFWEKYPNVIGGCDMEPGKEGGTWLAMSKKGKIAALLNILQPDEEMLPNKKGRGFLVTDYVVGKKDYFNYLKNISEEGENYNEFCLVTMDYSNQKKPKIACYNNHILSAQPTTLEAGIYAFGNSINPLEVHWPKVSEAKAKFCDIIKGHTSVANKDSLISSLFKMLQDRTCYPPDELMIKQGKSKPVDFLKKLSSIYVSIPEANYGSRCHTVIIVDGSGTVDYLERNRPEVTIPEVDLWNTNNHSFKLHW